MNKKIIATAAAVIAVISSTTAASAMAATSENTGVLKTNISIAKLEKVEPIDHSLEISLNKTSVKARKGKTLKLSAETNLDGYDVTYKSTDKKVASVSSDGVVKLKKKGTAKIVAECNGVKTACNVTVKNVPQKPKGNNLSDAEMSSIASEIGWQTQYAYPESTVMCSAYSFAYAYRQVTGASVSAGSFWIDGCGCNWDGGTYSRYGSAEEMLAAIKSEIDNNKACVGLLSCSSPTHYVTFYGYEGNGDSLSDFKILDPWDGNLTTGAGYGYCGDGYHVVTVNA